jgi:hypothetical protein
VANGLIDFTKGDSPVYIEDFKMEEYWWIKCGKKQCYLL